MLTCEALERRRDGADHVYGIAPLAHRADVRDRDAAIRYAERLLHRLARYRTGGDEIDAAFPPEELRRVRSFLIAAGTARGRLVQPRRKRAAT